MNKTFHIIVFSLFTLAGCASVSYTDKTTYQEFLQNVAYDRIVEGQSGPPEELDDDKVRKGLYTLMDGANAKINMDSWKAWNYGRRPRFEENYNKVKENYNKFCSAHGGIPLTLNEFLATGWDKIKLDSDVRKFAAAANDRKKLIGYSDSIVLLCLRNPREEFVFISGLLMIGGDVYYFDKNALSWFVKVNAMKEQADARWYAKQQQEEQRFKAEQEVRKSRTQLIRNDPKVGMIVFSKELGLHGMIVEVKNPIVLVQFERLANEPIRWVPLNTLEASR